MNTNPTIRSLSSRAAVAAAGADAAGNVSGVGIAAWTRRHYVATTDSIPARRAC